MDCRPSCAACCIAPSISSPIPGMPDGKPAGCAASSSTRPCAARSSADRSGPPCAAHSRRPKTCAVIRASRRCAGSGGWKKRRDPSELAVDPSLQGVAQARPVPYPLAPNREGSSE
ncbi:YkgJ family cysteine cluster protein [Roseateles chitinivorans]|uniref:YkgJ family cysteine cluster protein n=1 Tax=Roseateles chitinivorans TaxID=2917965 RepID=UPI003D67E4B9